MRMIPFAFFSLVCAIAAPLQANSGPLIVADASKPFANSSGKDCEKLSFLDPDAGILEGPEDLSACFHVSYDAANKILTITASAKDDVRVTQRSQNSLPNGLGQNPDGALVYLDLWHRSTFAEKIELSLVSREIAAADDELLAPGIVSITRTYPSPQNTMYQWTIKLDALARERGLPDAWLASDALIVGFDLVVFDRDSETDGAILKWTEGANDGMENRDLGDLLIWPEAPSLTRVSGKAVWRSPERETAPPRFAHFTSEMFPHLIFRALTDPSGRFEMTLPQGRYRAVASDSRSVFGQAPQVSLVIGGKDKADPATIAGKLPDAPVETMIDALMKEHGVRTVGLGWIEGGHLRTASTLGANANDEPAGDDTVFRTASITKLVTTMTVLALVANGEWDLDEPLVRHWIEPDLAVDARYRTITTRMVLRHLSGLPNWREGSALSFESDPGAQQGYSGEAFEILRHALESATGESLETLARRHVLDPAGMTNTSLRWSTFAAPHFAGEYWGTGAALRHYRGDEVNAAANMLSTPQDLLLFAQWFMDWCDQNPELAHDLITPNPAELMPDERADWSPNGLGWFVQDRDGTLLLEHSGGQNGINTHLLVVPETRSALVVLTNSSAGWPLVRAAFQQTLNRERAFPHTLERLYGDIRF